LEFYHFAGISNRSKADKYHHSGIPLTLIHFASCVFHVVAPRRMFWTLYTHAGSKKGVRSMDTASATAPLRSPPPPTLVCGWQPLNNFLYIRSKTHALEIHKFAGVQVDPRRISTTIVGYQLNFRKSRNLIIGNSSFCGDLKSIQGG
jgi:hypothetical protein